MTAMATNAVISLDSIPGVWRGARQRALAPTESTGSQSLDDALQGGWPQGSLTQIVSRHAGFGFSMIVPSFARLTRTGRQVALVNTPHQPYAPALDSRGVELSRLLWIQPKNEEQALWTIEQLLISGLFSAVAFWTRSAMDGNTERRLQLAAETSRCLAIAFRKGSPDTSSYAALKLAIAPAAGGEIAVDVLKCRGGRAGRRFTHAISGSAHRISQLSRS